MLRDNNKKRRIVVVGKGGSGGGIDQVQSDWNQTDNTQVDYIKNKPTVYNEWFGTQVEYDAISVKDPDTIYYIEGDYDLDDITITQNGTYTHSGYYGYDEVEVNVQPNLTTLNATVNGTYTPTSPAQGYSSVTVNVGGYVAPQYLTGTYMVSEDSNNFTILNNTDNISGWRFKGDSNWETPATTITANGYGMVEIEFNLIDNTSIGNYQFNGVSDLIKIDFPSTITSIGQSAFFYTGLTELPNLTNVTSIGDDCFFACVFNYVDYTINDNIDRSGWNLKSMNFSSDSKIGEKMYVNGTVYRIYKRFNTGGELDFSNGIGGLPIYKWRVYGSSYGWNLNTMKFPATLTHMGGRSFQNCTITNVYFYGTTPPVCEIFDQQGIWYNSNITNIYVPASALSDYQNSADFADVVSKIQAMP